MRTTQEICDDLNETLRRMEERRNQPGLIVRHAKTIKHCSFTYAGVCGLTGFLPAAAAWGLLGGMAHLLDKKFSK